MILLRLFAEFFLVGLMAFGGGMATVPFLQELSTRTGWYSAAELADMIAISEATPGPIGVNLATYTGFKTAGLPGVVAATFGIVAPSVIIILIITKVLQRFRENKDVDSAFYGLRPASCALICTSVVMLLRNVLLDPVVEAGVAVQGKLAVFNWLLDWRALILLAVLIPPVLKTKLHPLIFLVIAAVVGIIVKL